MLSTSLAVLALSASAAVSPFSHFVHMHPHTAQADDRVSLTLYNKSANFRDVQVDGKTYTVLSHSMLLIKAPAGTVVFTRTTMPFHKAGDALLQVTPKLNNQKVVID